MDIKGSGRESNSQLKEKEFKEMLEAFEKRIELDPENADAWYGKGTCLFNLRKYKEALEAFEKRIELDPENADAWYGKGTTLAMLEKYKEALEAFEKRIELGPENADAWYGKGICLFDLRKYKEALEAFERVIELDPKNADAWTFKGHALAMLGKEKEGLESFERAIELDPKNAGAWWKRGAALNNFGENREALESFERAIELDPENADAWWGKGIPLFNLKKYREALESFERAIELDPESIMAYIYLGYLFLIHDDIKNSSKSIKKALAINDKNGLALLLKGRIEIEKGNYDDAVDSFRKAIYGKLGDVRPLLWIAYAKYLKIEYHLEGKKYQEEMSTIIRGLERARELSDNIEGELKACILYFLGYFYYKNNDIYAATERLEECTKLRSWKDLFKSKSSVERRACNLLDNLWNYTIRPPWWKWWLYSPFNRWVKRILFSILLLSIFSLLLFHLFFTENLEFIAQNWIFYIASAILLFFFLLSPHIQRFKTKEVGEIELLSPPTFKPFLSPSMMKTKIEEFGGEF